jgi:hypothetical protein
VYDAHAWGLIQTCELKMSLAVQPPKDEPPTLLYWLLVAYPVGTALVELARVNFDASRFGFLTASWHNLFEYGILLFAFFDYATAAKVRPASCIES